MFELEENLNDHKENIYGIVLSTDTRLVDRSVKGKVLGPLPEQVQNKEKATTCITTMACELRSNNITE